MRRERVLPSFLPAAESTPVVKIPLFGWIYVGEEVCISWRYPMPSPWFGWTCAHGMIVLRCGDFDGKLKIL